MQAMEPTNVPEDIIEDAACPNCGLASETNDQFCDSCSVEYQQIIDIVLKRLRICRRAPLYFLEAVCLYRNWRREHRRQRVLNRALLIDAWVGRNRHNEAEEERFWELHTLFTEFLCSALISQAEEKLEEMFKVLERS